MKSIKLISALMIAVMLIMVATPVFANDTGAGDIISTLETDIKNNRNDPSSDGSLREKIGKIIGVVQWVGIIAGVLILAIFGIKYMLGSLEEKAEYKKTMIPFIVGAIVLMLAPQLAKVIFNIVGD